MYICNVSKVSHIHISIVEASETASPDHDQSTEAGSTDSYQSSKKGTVTIYY